MMRRGTGFDADEAWPLLLEEGQHVALVELTTDNDIVLRIAAVDPENRLRDVETDCRDQLT